MNVRNHKRLFRWAIGVLLTPIALFSLLFLLLYFPPVQQWVVEQVARYASDATGLDIRVERIRLRYPLDLDLRKVVAYDSQQGDTIFSLQRLGAGIALRPLLVGRVEISRILMTNVHASADSLIPSIGINGDVGRLELRSGAIDIEQEHVKVKSLQLRDANVKIVSLQTNEPDDTVSQKTHWKINLQEAMLQRVDFAMEIPADSFNFSAGLDETSVKQLAVDLGDASYRTKQLTMGGGYIEGNLLPVSLAGIAIAVDSFLMDTAHLQLSRMLVKTKESEIQVYGEVKREAFSPGGDGKIKLNLYSRIGLNDLKPWIGTELSTSFATVFRSNPIQMESQLEGNVDAFTLNTLQMKVDSIGELLMDGRVECLTDSLHRKGLLNLTLRTFDSDSLVWAVNTSETSFSIPSNMRLNANFQVERNDYGGVLTLNQESPDVMDSLNTESGLSDSLLVLSGAYNMETQAYRLYARADSFPIYYILPNDSLHFLTGQANIKGCGFDPYAVTTRLHAEVVLDSMQYGKQQVGNIHANATLSNNNANLMLHSDNPLLQLDSNIDALLLSDSLHLLAQVTAPKVDLYALNLVDNPLTAAVDLSVEGETDWQKAYSAKGSVTGMDIQTSKEHFQPKDVQFDVLTEKDTTVVNLTAGDLALNLNGGGDVTAITEQINHLFLKVQEQLLDRKLEIEEVKQQLPDVSVQLKAGEDNPAVNYLNYISGMSMSKVDISLTTSSLTGVNGEVCVNSFRMDSIDFDTVRLSLLQDTIGINYRGLVKNVPNKWKPIFTMELDGIVSDTESDVLLHFYNEKQELGLELGVRAKSMNDSLIFSLFPEHPTVGFTPFSLNDSNYVLLDHMGRLTADMSLLDQTGAGLRFYSSPNEEVTQDLTIDLTGLNLEKLLKMLPYAPDVRGALSSEVHLLMNVSPKTEEEHLSVSATMKVDDLAYEQYPVGTMGAEVVYLPTTSGEHIVNLQLLRDDELVASADGSFRSSDNRTKQVSVDEAVSDRGGSGMIDVNVSLERLPLEMVNAFVPREVIMLDGTLKGELTLQGAVEAPRMNGYVSFDSVRVHSSLYGVDFTFDRNPVTVTDNHLAFNDFNIYARGKNPFTLTGNIDMSDFAHMTADLRMRAVEYELLNAKESKESVLYGKAFISLFSTIKGEVLAPVVRGTMNVLGTTDVTYVLKDSPLTVDDRLGSMVTFVNFNDTIVAKTSESKGTLGGLDLLFTVQIDEGAEVQVDLSDDNYVKVQGGGNLSLQYTPQGDLLLTGRYTLNSGEMKYSLPVIPLKTFNIKGGSYVEFTGNPANPFLNVTATERVRTSVTEESASRYVNFDVGVSITNSLSDMGLSFTLEAPEDVSLQNQLAAMSAEERGKLALTMLVTGMYMGGQGGSTSGFSANNALNSFLQSEIANIAGSALKTVDVSIGVEDNYTADGTETGGTDYSFRFAKRFWNNRLSVIIGGRISTGNENVAKENNSFIDDISLEWRLDDSGTRYVKLFHSKNYEDILEGEIIETGIGVVLRRKVNKLGELFIFRKKNTSPTMLMNRKEEEDE